MALLTMGSIVLGTTGAVFGHVVSTRAFAVGLVYGAFAYLATGLIAALRHSTHEGGGLAFAAGVLFAVRDLYGARAVPAGVVLSIALLAVGGALAQRMRPRLAAHWYVGFARSALALAPGVMLLAATFPVASPAWLRFAAAVGALVAGVLVMDFDANQGPTGAPFALLALGALAVYYTAPDTRLPLVMLGCAIPLAFVSIPQPLRRMGPAGSAAATGVFVWIAVVGGRDRPGSAIAGVAALGLLIVEPIARRVPPSTVALGKRRRHPSRRPADRWIVIVAVAGVAQVAMGAFCAKIAGPQTDPVLVALALLPALVLLGAAAPVLLPLSHRVRSGPGDAVRTRRYAWMH